MRKENWLLTGLAIIVLAYPRADLLAQAVYGSIVGTVTDASGGVVPNATIKITNIAQGVTYSTATNDSGNYQQTHLNVGKYRVHIEAPGFVPFEQGGAAVYVDAVTQVNAELQIGATTQTLTVNDDPVLLKTTKTDVADTFTQRTLQDLPLPSRDFGRLIYLAPGVTGTGTGASSEQPQDIYRPRVSGQYWGGISVQLDGTDNRESVLGAMVIAPNIDAISEAKITTGAYDAEFGQANQAIISVQTKSGTNDVHGSTFWYHRDDSSFARNPFTQSKPIAGTSRFIPHTDWNLFGGAVGGRIRKDKLFYFMDYQGARQIDGGSVLARVPTAAERAGDLSDLGVNIFNPCPAGVSPQSQTTSASTICIVAPASRSQFMGNNGTTPNVIPTGLLSPQALGLLQLIPLPNISGVTNPAANNFQGNGTAITNSDSFDVRVDLFQSQKIHMFGRYSLQQYQQSAPGAFGAEAGGPALINGNASSFAGTSDLRNQSLAYGIDYFLRPNFLGDFRFGFFRARVLVNPNGLGTAPASDAGIPNLNLDSYYTSGMPAFILTQGSSTLGGAATASGTGSFVFGYSLNGNNNCNCPLNEQQNQFQYVTNWTYIRSNHSIKFGVDFRHHQNLRVPSDTHRSGQLTFDSLNTSGPEGGGLGLATFLLGDVSTFGRYVSNITTAAERQNRWFLYTQDTWRLTPKLTVNYGVRWEIYRPQYVNAAGNGGVVSISTGEVTTMGENGTDLKGDIKTNLTHIGPRIGIAYQVQPRTVIRMGYGRSFDVGVFGTSFGHSVTQNLPVLANQTINPSTGSGNLINYSAFNLANGPGAPPNPATLLNGQPTGTDGNPILPKGVTPNILPLTSKKTMRLPVVDTWNVTLERQFGSNFVASVGYVGNKGTDVFPGSQNYNPNMPILVGFDAPGVNSNARLPFNNYAQLSTLLAASGLPPAPPCSVCQPYGWTQSVKYFSDDASNHYNSLQARAEKRFSQGLSFQATYTWQTAFDYTNDYFFWSPKVDYGPEDGVRKHVFTALNVYELPFGRGRKFMHDAPRALDLLLGGWQLSGNWTWQSGLPFTPTYSNCGQDRDTGPCKPNIVGPVETGLGVNNWFTVASTKLTNPARSATNVCPNAPGITSGPWQEPACRSFGNVGRNSLYGPHLFNADLALAKTFAIAERFRLQFRAESFNAFNHANLGQPDASIDDGTPGKITGIAALTTMRRFQFALHLEF
jgi:Carboxypeptidase regulatory-like domain